MPLDVAKGFHIFNKILDKMKHSILVVIAISAIAFTSCKRTHRCSCYSPALNQTTPSFEIKGTKKEAKDECESQPLRGRHTGMDYVCNLK